MQRTTSLVQSDLQDEYYMQAALSLAKKGLGWTNPNPMVGCVIVKDNKIIGNGYHIQCGQAHAEINALENCKVSPNGATLYCTLEPCNHYGRTPPCSETIVKAGIKRVVIGADETNIIASGSIAYFIKNNIKVTHGVLANTCNSLNPIFHHYSRLQKPFVVAKWAMTLTGKMQLNSPEDQNISSPESQLDAHYWRQYCDAIVIGVTTLIKDNPRLTTRYNESNIRAKHPLRVVLDSKGSSPLSAAILAKNSIGKTLIVTGKEVSQSWKQAIRNQGHNVLTLPLNNNNQIPLTTLLSVLYDKGIKGILVEGGANVRDSFLQQGLVDQVIVYVAGVEMQKGRRSNWLMQTCQSFGDDIKITYKI